MRDLLIAAIVFGLLPFVLSRPTWGVYLSAWLGYMNAHRLCYGFMLSFPVVMVVALTTLVGMVFSKEKTRMIWSREIIVLMIMIAWMGVTTTQAFFFDLALEQYEKVIKIQILTIMTLMLLTSRDKVHIFVWIIALSLGFYGIKGGLFTIAHGGSYRVQGPLGTFIGGNNELALALVMTIPLMRYLHLQETRKWLKLGLAGAMLLTAIAAVGSQSRGALVGIAIMGVIFWFKSRNKFMSAILILVAVGAIGSVMPQEWYDRMDTIKTYQEDRSAQGRINAWWFAYNVAMDRVTGGGFEMSQYPVFRQYAPIPNMVHDAHSIYFEMLGEHGFIGLFLFLTLLGLTWLKCGSIIRKAKRDPELKWAQDLAAMIQVSMIAYMTSGAFLGLAYFDYIYHLVAITVVMAHLVTQPHTAKNVTDRAQGDTPSPHPPLALGKRQATARP
jgi:probable O-glycosylation ligase (exosortase A-associated)